MNSKNIQKQDKSDDIAELHRQIEAGALFNHTTFSHLAGHINEIESFLYGLIDLLILKKISDQSEIVQLANKASEQLVEWGQIATAGVAMRFDGAEQPPAKVNCAERLHICKAVCCKLSFPLSQEEIEGGIVKWDLGRPYYNRSKENGYCVHIDQPCLNCKIYEHRPQVCKVYDCSNDKRIWKDFENMVLNEDWLEENLGEAKPQLMNLMMYAMPDSNQSEITQ